MDFQEELPQHQGDPGVQNLRMLTLLSLIDAYEELIGRGTQLRYALMLETAPTNKSTLYIATIVRNHSAYINDGL